VCLFVNEVEPLPKPRRGHVGGQPRLVTNWGEQVLIGRGASQCHGGHMATDEVICRVRRARHSPRHAGHQPLALGAGAVLEVGHLDEQVRLREGDVMNAEIGPLPRRPPC